jgi:serine/threonine-protein kinase
VVSPVAQGLALLTHVSTEAAMAAVAGRFLVAKTAVGAAGAMLLVMAFLLLLPWAAARAGEVGAGAAAPAVAQAGAGSIGRYVLLQQIGGGGMAEVHLAVSLGESGFRRPCVVKRLRPELADNVRAVAQFTDEATLASSLVHANIVPIFDFGREGNQYFIVQEYICGRDLGRLAQRLRERAGRLSPEIVGYIAAEVLRALEYAHGKRGYDGRPLGIVHRDVSPENIMISLRGEVRLADFGVLKTSGPHRSQTDPGALKGNLAFMAPEQARGLEVDGRADLHALGQVLYFALTGESLYDCAAGYDLLTRAAAGVGPTERRKIGQLPPRFAAALERALAPRPDERFATAAEFAAKLPTAASDPQAQLAALMSDLFAHELLAEQQQLATVSSSIRPYPPHAHEAARANGHGKGLGGGIGVPAQLPPLGVR